MANSLVTWWEGFAEPYRETRNAWLLVLRKGNTGSSSHIPHL